MLLSAGSPFSPLFESAESTDLSSQTKDSTSIRGTIWALGDFMVQAAGIHLPADRHETSQRQLG